MCYWFDWRGNPSGTSTGVTTIPKERLQKVIQGDVLGWSQNYSFETQIIFELANYTTTWKARKRFWAMIRVLNNFGSCVEFGTKYRLRTLFVPLGVISKGKRMIRLARHPLNLKIILHVDLSLSLYARHCLIGSTLVRYPC